ncbi:MAG: hydroxymethylglutaryl-CoA lyase [Achromobacter sp.]|jgi:hydroxymethylglutaryl-CoA lyase|uniref:Hydroxymethylglutaryl-CoA lyase YngG n=1 Tax=Achromobacter insuavis TaxID=1287735 RepID=A0A6J4ZHK5_9BURK|nr:MULTISPECIES: hydroxymethylglutaryl-CoA lyase [Achromobacter]MBN9642918.1 hydroxymethylglutaryl-CoA lyase [Achromobacter sp.]CAB3623908.1 Hydroxymethylglutaryl-CoA lyase YngG [Achromobacter insuavis]CUJ65853.1 Hydroxymethylglutaryl-CoA lyase yngG [Achromobacter sp. 2789STDY5608633]CUJ80296.1 Hydroxymethylglutaryl-CoA lyase yngG [Achromobacter sp. 2789STDY5608628]
MEQEVRLCEVGPRDGLQMARGMMAADDKLRWIRQLAAAGLREIEVGSFVSPRLVPQMADTGQLLPQVLGIDGLTVCALACNLKGAIAAYEAGAHVIAIPVSVSDTHSHANVGKGTDAQVEAVATIADWLRSQARPARLDVAVATAFGCSMEGAVPVRRVAQVAAAVMRAGADEIALADTVGYAHPAGVREAVRAAQDAVGARLVKLHLHDTMGLGLANALAGLDEGIRAFDACLGGLGGCPFAPGASGNIVTEDLVFMLESMGYRTGVDLPRLLAARALLAASLPRETLRSGVAAAGIPRTYPAAMAA